MNNSLETETQSQQLINQLERLLAKSNQRRQEEEGELRHLLSSAIQGSALLRNNVQEAKEQ